MKNPKFNPKAITVWMLDSLPSIEQINAAAQEFVAKGCQGLATESIGLTKVPGVVCNLVEDISGVWLMHARKERRILPGSVVQARADEMAEKFERETGMKPGKKMRKSLKDDAIAELIPKAFVRASVIPMWISVKHRMLFIATTSSKLSDELLTILSGCMPGVRMKQMSHAVAPHEVAALMADMMGGESPANLVADRCCQLSGTVGDKVSVVTIKDAALSSEPITDLLSAGQHPTRLKMTWNERLTFTLTNDLKLTGLKMSGVIPSDIDPQDIAGYLTIINAELAQAVADLSAALGFELDSIYPEA